MSMWNPKKRNLLAFTWVLASVLAGIEWWEVILGDLSVWQAILTSVIALSAFSCWLGLEEPPVASDENLGD